MMAAGLGRLGTGAGRPRVRWHGLAVLGVAAGLLWPSCGSPSISTLACSSVPDPTLQAIGTRLQVAGALRNGQMVRATTTKMTFVSAELHRHDDRNSVKGDILTFATSDPTTGPWMAVDARAREHSAWPAAPFDVRTAGVI